MADTPTSRNRFRKQEVGAKTNAWGGDLNEDGGSDRLDESLDGVFSSALSGSYSLTSVNFETDEARKRVVNVTGGTGGTITIPAVEKNYLVRAGSSGDLIISNGSNSVTVKSGNIVPVFTDGTNIYQARCLDYGSDLLKSTGTPSLASHLVNKAYVDSTAFSSSLPGQGGNAGKVLGTDGTNASWGNVSLTAAVTGVLPEANGGTGQSALGTGVGAFLASPTSANLRTAITDETGNGALLFANGAMGTPSAITLTNGTGLPISTGVSGLGTGVATFLATPSSANLRAALTDETGTGAAVFATYPTFTAADSSAASLKIGHGSAPSSPNDGDVWTTTAGLFTRINGVTYQLGGSAQISTTQNLSGNSAVAFTSIPATYNNLLLVVAGASASTTVQVRFGISANNGGAWADQALISSALAAEVFGGACRVFGYQQGEGVAALAVDVRTSSPSINGVSVGGSCRWMATGGINAVRISLDTGTFDAGTVSLFGF